MKITVCRKAHFNAAHRLHNPALTNEENAAEFGKCNNEFFHGHNYELIVHVHGEVHPRTGYLMDMKVLKDIIKTEVEDYLDHKNLNIQVAEFKTLNPTAEHIAYVIWNRLRRVINNNLDLKVTLYETPRNYVEYNGQ
ncbi:6-carboxytetrahydropterin synthase [Schleiferiaceae bacterium]|jgi:6-pyruvoyltetrahydropterin/6-carboxytetrahydropterin synthase|nr:6-pyruvoyl tetrahydrobiopterin synthase [Flavobacteriales bacterium]MDC1021924.1 6-carboxytetrahydropterin synthase [Schleiferiaceae bacterium]|tara:strand:- start:1155 stop:1565 length:411 start_codon:yes stop_codon:yes gene_type:complete